MRRFWILLLVLCLAAWGTMEAAKRGVPLSTQQRSPGTASYQTMATTGHTMSAKPSTLAATRTPTLSQSEFTGKEHITDIEAQIAGLEAQLYSTSADEVGVPMDIKLRLNGLYALRPANRRVHSLDQGADACPATVISSCPYTDSGTTTGSVNNYNTATCASSNAPDVVYQFTPTSTSSVTVSLCGSGYDTALEIRTGGACPGTTQVGCNDDFCGLQSQLTMTMTAGVTYFIIVDGFSTSSGAYTLNMTCAQACAVICQGGDIIETTEPASPDSINMLTDPDGGCNNPTPLFGTVLCGQTICGRAFTYLRPSGTNVRDTDWYRFTITQPETVRVSARAEFPLLVGIVNNVNPCASPVFVASAVNSIPCSLTVATAVCLAPGTYAMFVAPSVFAGVPLTARYRATLTCSPSCLPCVTDYIINAPGSTPDVTTCGAVDNCSLRAGEDLLVRVNVATAGQYTFSLCRSDTNWDTYMYVTTACCGGTILAQDDDACPEFGVGYSLISCLQLAVGTYYVDIEPFASGVCGRVRLSVNSCSPCIVPSQSGDIPEVAENPADTTFYRTDPDGGCNSTPPMFQNVLCTPASQTAYGSCFTYNSPLGQTRDTDWFLFDVEEAETVYVTVRAEFDVLFGIIQNVSPCNAPAFAVSNAVPPCSTASVQMACLTPGTYAMFVGPNVFTGIPTPAHYRATLRCSVPCGGAPPPPFLRIGPWMNPEPWHDWFGGPNDITPLQLHIFDPLHTIQFVEFDYSLNHQAWIPFYMDHSGYEGIVNTIDHTVADSGDGWSGYFQNGLLPQTNMQVYFRAIAVSESGTTIVENRGNYDPTPPNSVTLNVTDWQTVPGNTITVDIDPVLANIEHVIYWCTEKQESFAKGIPGINQRPHSDNHCVPTAAAACLMYYQGQGDPCIGGGLTPDQLVDALGGLMGTDPASGTNLSSAANGLKKWIEDHCNGYTVRGPMPYNWQQSRDELERCQDVLSTIDWPGGGRHEMTFNSIQNRPMPNGHIGVDFMDPWTGQIENGEIDPATNTVSNFSGAGAGGRMSENIIVCPKEPDDGGGGPPPPPPPPPGPNPPPWPIPIPHPGLWFLHAVVIDLDGHAYRLIRVIKRLLPPVLDLVIYSAGVDVQLYWTAVPGATFYRVYTAPTADGPWTFLATTSVPSYTHVNGASSTRLFYRVTSNRP